MEQKLVKVTSELQGKIHSAIEEFKRKNVLIIGDIGLDEYVIGEVRRISPEAPVPILEVDSTDFRLGLSGNVAQNVRSLGGFAYLVGVVGNDSNADKIRGLLREKAVPDDHLVVDSKRPTTSKVRMLAKHNHLLRVDYESRRFILADIENKVVSTVEQLIENMDAVIIEDYAKGVITKDLFKRVLKIAQAKGKKVYVDPHRTNTGDFYTGADLIKPNFDEAIALSGLTYDELRDHPSKVLEVGKALQKKIGAKEIVMTRGKDGMTVLAGGEVIQVPTFAREVFDVTGAGDTVIASLALGMSSKLSLVESCVMANFAAGYVVGQIGCVPCTAENLKNYMSKTLENQKQ